jgi:hypothetical protein
MADAPRLTPAREAARIARETRSAQSLRENLRRRKEQARGREADRPGRPAAAPVTDDPTA